MADEQKSATPRDEVFRSTEEGSIADYRYGPEVANVFDDMIVRSVPLYHEIQRMIGEMASDIVTPGSRVYDLGCSSGTTMLALDPAVTRDATFVGIDNSEDMLAKCREKLGESGFARPYELECLDLNQGVHVENASLALLVLTLQFIRPLNRERLMADLFRGLKQNGAVILVEKVLGEDSHFNRLFIKYYYDMKRRNGYSETEISHKREALENVLVPYKLLENRELLLRTGFRYVDVFFKWYNYCGIIAIK
jgi:tRNA (cmo5U34)-methyltransferase